MIFKRHLFATLSMTIVSGIVSLCPVFGAQTATDNAKTVSFPMENSLVSRYLQHADNSYSNGIGRTGTSVLCYWLLGNDVSPYMIEVPETGGLPGWPEQCAPVVISAVNGGTVRVSPSPTFKNYITISAKSTSVSVYNLLPQTIYWYKVLDANNKQVSKGVFKTQGYLRMIWTEKVLNVRDIGGWKCDGGRLAYGKIIRGAALEGITDEAGPISSSDILALKNELNIGSEVDLRSDATISVSPLGTGVEYKKIPIEHYLYLLENTKPKSAINSGDYYTKLASLIDYLIKNMKANKATYLHCKWGADRTGTVLALIEALCGVSEADIVKEWELTSFNAICYRKYINVQEIKYYYLDSKNKLQNKPSELRAVFEYLYNNYGGTSGASLKEQVTRWLQDKVYASRSDKGASVIAELQSLLITPEKKSPFIVKDLSKEIDSPNYSVTKTSTIYYDSEESKYIIPSTGKTADSDAFSCTGFINCKGYSYLHLNAVCSQIGAYYDANKKFVGKIEDTTVSNTYGSGAVLFEDREYKIPTKAVYVKLNMPKYCDWTAVFSVDSLLQ